MQIFIGNVNKGGNIMAFFDKMKDSISVAGQGVQQKAKTATESVRIGNMIKNNERMIEKLIYQVGVQCVKNHIDDSESEYEELFNEIIRLRIENQEYEAEIQSLTAVSMCSQCGYSNKPEAKFCISCGAPLGSAVSENGKKCVQCGAVNVEDAVFCTECGSRLEEILKEKEPIKNICENCGAELADDSAFCTECGTKREY